MFVGRLIWIPLRYFLTNTAKTFYAVGKLNQTKKLDSLVG